MLLVERQVAERERRGVGVSTPERVRHAGETELDIAPAGHQRISQAPLDQLRAKGHLTQRLFDAGDRYRTDGYEAGIIGSGSMPLEPSDRRPASGLPSFMRTARAAAALDRYGLARAQLKGTRRVVELVCWADVGLTMAEVGKALGYTNKRSAQVAAMAVLRVGLENLAEHYGL